MADEFNLRTPAEFEPTLRWIVDQDDQVIDVGVDVFAARIYDRVAVFRALSDSPGWDPENAAGTLRVLESLSDVQRLLHKSWDVIAKAAAADRKEAEQTVLADRLERFLSSDAIQMISRGRELAGEREHVLDDARILTDIRPLFTPPRTDRLDGAIITHSLRLSYTGSAEPALHIALDKAHLEVLQGLVQRALDKSSHLEGELAKLGVAYIEPGGDLEKELRARLSLTETEQGVEQGTDSEEDK